ncbi:MAG: ABC transporter ATP-binding protein [Rhodopirellula sp.]|nr:ABC transporter ATP-binding protein [Rhodopirellula sp.]|tara:strand:- start:146 stop:829 length:684 start_codon:yes stop_codon:yes gene_type:complete
MLKIRNLKFRYAESPFSLEIPHLDVAEGQHTAITGASGCGKTTLLNLLAGIIPLDLFPSSQICVAGESLSEKTEADLRRYRNETLGFVFQDFRLIEYLSLKDNILLPFTLSSRPVTTEINQRCDDLIQRIGLSTHGGRCVTQLSRGEQQRVAVCRAILGEPTLILADEPTANLDRDNAEGVWQLLFEHATDMNATIVAVTHNLDGVQGFSQVLPFTEINVEEKLCPP